MTKSIKKKMIKTLKKHARENGWSQCTYDIVRGDIRNNEFKTVDELKIYITT